MSKRIYRNSIASLMILCLIALNLSGTFAAPQGTFDKPDNVVTSFLETRMNALVTKNTDSLAPFFSTNSDESKKYMLYNQINLIEESLIPFATLNFNIEKVVPEIAIKESNISGNVAIIKAIVKADIYWNAANPLKDAVSIIGKKTEQHLITLIKENDIWKITVDKFQARRGCSSDLIKENISSISGRLEDLKLKSTDVIEKAKKSKATKLEVMPIKKGNSKNVVQNPFAPIAPMSITSTYDRYGAYNWAYTFYWNYSDEYKDMSYSGGGGDCTNFVSQCIRAGGANNDNSGSYTWWYNQNGTPTNTTDDTWSWTWGTASGLNWAVRGNYTLNEYGPKAYAITITGDSNYSNSWGQYLQYGDFIQYETVTAGEIRHSAFIMNVVYDYNNNTYTPMIAEHTPDNWNIPWAIGAIKTYFMYMTGIN